MPIISLALLWWRGHSLPWDHASLPAHPPHLRSTENKDWIYAWPCSQAEIKQDLLIHANMIYLYRCKFDKKVLEQLKRLKSKLEEFA